MQQKHLSRALFPLLDHKIRINSCSLPQPNIYSTSNLRHIWNSVKHLLWSLFVETDNILKPFAIFKEELHRGSLTGFLMRFYPIILFIYSKHRQHFLECLTNFQGMVKDFPWNLLRQFPKCLMAFTGMINGIPQNIWQHPLECNTPSIPRVLHILFFVPVFLVLYIAESLP